MKSIDTIKPVFYITEDNKKIINFNGNIVLIVHANSENLNSRINFPRMEYDSEEGLVFFYCKSGRFYLELINGKKILIVNITIITFGVIIHQKLIRSLVVRLGNILRRLINTISICFL